MEIALLIARLFLALVFGVAGIAKVADRRGSRRSLIEFGVPERLAAPLSLALPFVEILVALALLPRASAWWGAIGALALFLSFTAGIAVNLARGQSPDCRCFGQLHSAPVSWTTLGRNLALVAIAGLVVFAGSDNTGLSAVSWLNDLKASEAVNLVLGTAGIGLLIAAVVLLKKTLGQQQTLLKRIEAIKTSLDEEFDLMPVQRKEAVRLEEGLPIGALAPKFSLATVDGDRVSLDNLLAEGKYLLLLFVGPNCWGCKSLLPAAMAWQRDYDDRLNIAVLSDGSLKQIQASMAKYEINTLLLDENSAIARDYQSAWTPAAVVIGPDGRIATHLTFGDHAVRKLVRDFVASGPAQPMSRNGEGTTRLIPQVALNYSVRNIGEPAPSFSLPDLSGRVVCMEDLIGSATLLLIWHPQCEFCRAMSDDLRRWEEYPPIGAPKLVLIASGKLEEIRALNKDFKSLTLFDAAFEVPTLLGTRYTPSAILIDSEGRIASSLAMGDHNVRALFSFPGANQQEAAKIYSDTGQSLTGIET